ncbi:MAG: class I SAM-dependent methyltransferase [archaeon]
MNLEEKQAKKIYNNLSQYYHDLRTKKHPNGWFYNEMLEMPSTLELLGNVKGKKILDFGCGSGIYAKLLTKKGAIVKGFDISNKIIEIARKENPKLDLRIGSGYNIPFKEKFDIVQASLVLDYFKDWDKVFKQVYNILNDKGYFVFSLGNPIAECTKKIKISNKKLRVLGENDYFSEKRIYAFWTIENKKIKIYSYHKTYETIIKIILRNGFEIVGYKDTYPLKRAKTSFPKDYKLFSKIPYFCVWKVKKK